jgi:hypothetical protein
MRGPTGRSPDGTSFSGADPPTNWRKVEVGQRHTFLGTVDVKFFGHLAKLIRDAPGEFRAADQQPGTSG